MARFVIGWLLLGFAALAFGEQPVLQPRMGQRLQGLTSEEAMRFQRGRSAFGRVLTPLDGRGPIFNQNGCGSCHSQPVLGGAGTIEVTRFGAATKEGFDPLEQFGGSLLQSQANSVECAETIWGGATVIANRVTPSVLGSGLIEAIPDEVIESLAENPPPGIHGFVHYVVPLEGPPQPRVGRFGWKAQVATVLTFSGDASLNELGLTNRLVPTENAPNGDHALLAMCDMVPDPEDHADKEGFEFIDRITDFQRFLAAPPQTPRSGMTGEVYFEQVGCGDCHVPSFVTADREGLESALRNQVIRPYSDFLLHDMGQLGDGIVQGMAGERMFRTPPLWGLRGRQAILHDGRADAGAFEERVTAAIMAHDAFLSEAGPSAQAFSQLAAQEKQLLLAFLGSLGRAEFDHEGDNDVDLADYVTTRECLLGPVDSLTPDDTCSISDLDQDGDVDLLDLAGLQRAESGPAE